jgi:hypothetical protein
VIPATASAAAVFIAAPAAAARACVIPPSPVPAMVVGRFGGAILLPVLAAIFLAGFLARLAGSRVRARQRCEGCRDGGDDETVLHVRVSGMTK